MLLRRITEHVKAQNWTAVALDFVIVVVGVYLGIQVNNWNEARAEARREAVYLAALKEDFGQIIAELEADARGPYAGGVGYFAPDGNMDSCIVLRTAIVQDGVMHVQAGAGIVADSDPAYEQRECEAKAGALFAAAREAVKLAGTPGYGQ